MEIAFNLGDPERRGRGRTLRQEGGNAGLSRGVAGGCSEGRGAPAASTRRVGGGEGVKGRKAQRRPVVGEAKGEE